MRMRRLVLCAIVAFLAVLLICSSIRKRHTFTLSNSEGTLSCFNISKDNIRIAIATYFYSSPKWLYLFCFYCTIIGYITHGMTEKIKLEKNKWYKVEGEGNLTMSPVNVRVE